MASRYLASQPVAADVRGVAEPDTLAVAEVVDGVFAIGMPMPNSPLKSMDAYLLRGDRNLLIDTGFNLPEAQRRLSEAFDSLGVRLEDTDIAITHLHSDHTGLLPYLLTPNSRAYMSYLDGRFLNEMVYIDYARKVEHDAALFGVPTQRVLRLAEDPSARYASDRYVDFCRVDPGDVLRVGEYCLEVVDLAGHTPGHIGFYDEAHAVMFCGDHVINGISPNIVDWNDGADSLALFCRNLTELKKRNIDYLFPAHRGRVVDWRARVDELLEHHQRRCDEILDALNTEQLTVFEVAEQIGWDFMGGNFAEFPPLQTWFSTSEAFAHLEHLRMQGRLQRHEQDGTWLYHTHSGLPQDSGSHRRNQA